MSTVSVMRLLRLEFGISARELAEAAGVSQQYVSDIELGKCLSRYKYNKSANSKLQKALEIVVKRRSEQAHRLADAFEKNRCRLLEFVEEPYEL